MERSIYDSFSPLDFRYFPEAAKPYFSEEGCMRYTGIAAQKARTVVEHWKNAIAQAGLSFPE